MFPSGPPGLFSLSVSRCEDQFVQPMIAEAPRHVVERTPTLCGWMNAHSVWMNDKTKANCIVISLFSLGFTVSAIHHYFLWYSGEVWIKFTQTLHDLYYNLYNATSKTRGKTYKKNESILKTTPKWFLDLNKSGRSNNHHFSKTTTPGTSPNCLVVHPTSWHIERWKHDDPIGNPRPGFQRRRIHEFKRGNGNLVGGPRVLRRDDVLRSSHPAPKKKENCN